MAVELINEFIIFSMNDSAFQGIHPLRRYSELYTFIGTINCQWFGKNTQRTIRYDKRCVWTSYRFLSVVSTFLYLHHLNPNIIPNIDLCSTSFFQSIRKGRFDQIAQVSWNGFHSHIWIEVLYIFVHYEFLGKSMFTHKNFRRWV